MKKKFFIKNLVLFLIPISIPILVLGSLSIFITEKYVKEEITKKNLTLLNQTRDSIDLILGELDNLSLTYDGTSQSMYYLMDAFSRTTLNYEDIRFKSIIMNSLMYNVGFKPFVHSVYIYYENQTGQFLSSTDRYTTLNDFPDTSWYESYKNQTPKKNTWAELRNIKQFKDDEKPVKVVTLYKRLNTYLGVIVLNIRASYIEKLLNDISNSSDQDILIIDDQKNVLFNNKKLVDTVYIDLADITAKEQSIVYSKGTGKNYFVSTLNSNNNDWKYISIQMQNSLYSVPIKLTQLTVFLLGLSFILALILTYFFTKNNYKRIESIVSILDSAETGTPLPSLSDSIRDEYSYIIHNILKTFIEQSYLKVQLSERKYKLQAAELAALQTQINPHFLFNTLNSIYWEVIGLTGKPNPANKMIENLSDILEYSLCDPNKAVTLKEEINNTINYIEILKIRYKDKFDVKWEYDDTVKQNTVIRLILQPLIENSIYHGIKEKGGKGMIKIKIRIVDSRLRIAVIDNGLGIAPERLEYIREKLTGESENSEHIGLFNTNRRLKLTYQDEYSIKIISKCRFGTAIYLQIPLQEAAIKEIERKA